VDGDFMLLSPKLLQSNVLVAKHPVTFFVPPKANKEEILSKIAAKGYEVNSVKEIRAEYYAKQKKIFFIEYPIILPILAIPIALCCLGSYIFRKTVNEVKFYCSCGVGLKKVSNFIVGQHFASVFFGWLIGTVIHYAKPDLMSGGKKYIVQRIWQPLLLLLFLLISFMVMRSVIKWLLVRNKKIPFEMSLPSKKVNPDFHTTIPPYLTGEMAAGIYFLFKPKIPEKVRKAAITENINLCDISFFAMKKPHIMSPEEKKLVILASVLSGKPKKLVTPPAKEIFVEKENRGACIAAYEKMKEQGVEIIYPKEK
jgi:hypothetical protein